MGWGDVNLEAGTVKALLGKLVDWKGRGLEKRDEDGHLAYWIFAIVGYICLFNLRTSVGFMQHER